MGTLFPTGLPSHIRVRLSLAGERMVKWSDARLLTSRVVTAREDKEGTAPRERPNRSDMHISGPTTGYMTTFRSEK